MKLRIRGNSLRLRLAQAEVSALAATGQCKDILRFSPVSTITYGLRGATDQSSIEARFQEHEISVSVPTGLLNQWAASGEVSLRGEQAIGDDERLTILIEKDFACLAPREDEDESDLFPHPLAGTGHTC